MDYDDLKIHYGQEYCFAPHQGDLFYDKKIEWHLKEVEKHCKECMERDVWGDIVKSLEFLEMTNKDAIRVIKGLKDALDCPYQEQRYCETYRSVQKLFILFGEGKSFSWV